MTVLEAVAILEAAVLECKKRDINTPEVKSALELLEPYVHPQWIIPQFRHHAVKHNGDSYAACDDCRNTRTISRLLRSLLQEERKSLGI